MRRETPSWNGRSSPTQRRGTAGVSPTRATPREVREDFSSIMTLLKIANGTVYDPAHGIDGEIRDLWIRDGKVIAPPGADAPGSPEVRPDRVLDATGLVVMPGGVDMHAHIAG